MRRLQRRVLALIAFVVLGTAAAPAHAQEPVRIGVGFGLAFLPIYLCEDLKLIEKRGKAAHLDLKASYQRFDGAGPLQDAIESGAIDMGPYGLAPLLVAWQKGKGSPRQMLALSGLTTLPVVLLSNQANVRTLADLRPADRIAIPTSTSPQAFLLEMQAEKVFGEYDRLESATIVLPHPDAIAALLGTKGRIAAYFSSPPYTQIALEDQRVHKVLSSNDIVDGKVSFLVLGAMRSYVTAHAKAAQIVAAAIDEAAQIIRTNPRRAAQIYLAHEPSRTLDRNAVEAIVAEIKDEFGSAVHGVQAFSEFMGRHGVLSAPAPTWKEIVAPALMNSTST